jgi:hypothetical protein
MLELLKIRKDINWLIDQVKCLIRKSDLDSPLSATAWTSGHSEATGDPYIFDSFAWYEGNVYKSLINNNIYPPTNATYWADLGKGHLLLEDPSVPTLQKVVNTENTIVMPTDIAKGIDITLSNVTSSTSVYQIGQLVTIPNKIAFPGGAPDAFVARINGQSPGSLPGFIGGFVAEVTGADNIAFFAGLDSNAEYSAGFWSRSTDNHTGPHFVAQKVIAGNYDNYVFIVENNGDTKVNTLSAAPSSINEDLGSRNIITAVNSDTIGPGGELYGNAISGQSIHGTAIQAVGKVGIYTLGVDKGIESYTTGSNGVGFYTETYTGVGVSSLSLGTGIAIIGTVFGNGTAIKGSSQLGKAAIFSIGATEEVNTNNIVEFDNNGILQAYVKHNGTIVSNKLLVNTTLDNGIDSIQVIGSIFSTLDAKINGLTVGRGGGAVISNITVGVNALLSNTTGTNNIAIGRGALYSNTTGNGNSAFGGVALYNNTTGYSNLGIGLNSLYFNTTGNSNVALGVNSLVNNTSGNVNVAIGRRAGEFLSDKTTASTILNNSILIGYRTSPLGNNQTNQIIIGHDATGLGSNTTVLGNTNTVTTAIYGVLLSGTTVGVASAQVQIDSTTRGFLPPRMTNAQRLAIASPAVGLCVYCTDATEGLYINKSTGWTLIG